MASKKIKTTQPQKNQLSGKADPNMLDMNYANLIGSLLADPEGLLV